MIWGSTFKVHGLETLMYGHSGSPIVAPIFGQIKSEWKFGGKNISLFLIGILTRIYCMNSLA
jgi:hypothetical protein